MSGFDDPEYMKRVREEVSDYFGGNQQSSEDEGLSPQERKKKRDIQFMQGLRRQAVEGN